MMQKSSVVRLWVGLIALAVFVSLGQMGYAAMQSGKGKIVGTVQTHEGKPAVGLVLKLVQDIPLDIRRPGSRGRSTGLEDSGAAALQGDKARIKTIAQATTDAQGKFTMNNIPEGHFRLEAGNRNIGWIYQDVSVAADQTVELNDLKLAKVN